MQYLSGDTNSCRSVICCEKTENFIIFGFDWGPCLDECVP